MEELTGPLEEVFKDLKRQWKDFQEAEPFLHVVQGFIHAIDWRERWIIGILVFHAVMLLAALTTRKSSLIQGTIFLIAAATVWGSERLNALGAEHWQSFAGQNYFDRTGVFMSVLVSGPLLLAMFIVLINYLISCSAMLVEAKRKELKYKARQRAAAEKKAAAGGGGGGAGGTGGGATPEAKKTK
ncbi:hypothetical protein CHLRE_02g142150v5 [Chlamydomonas reinhardtii]|uniref:Uncharacterized protein n=1 Tax=Chlamydomonas reinhardtii TaxID=3055 RepID=A8J0Q1_CHLRE|nr:uncharacterized protein CHLRE_02g142150v5 [Chlamydomonas reinhardtii]PNW87543.1 hypothetical protein CHLRE_02g142150v5 [Chlamydomonas reinhardtii]|eukprot:XP_001694971.1 predicted protein [Chlamydomonas reinhardtii]